MFAVWGGWGRGFAGRRGSRPFPYKRRRLKPATLPTGRVPLGPPAAWFGGVVQRGVCRLLAQGQDPRRELQLQNPPASRSLQ